MCKVTFYTNNDYGGDATDYSGPASKTGLPTGSFSGYDSLKTYDNSWLIIYDEDDYKGCTKKYYPNQSQSDLAKIDTESGDNNWKNDVRSFKLYDHCPTSWNLGFDLSNFHNYYPNFTKSSKIAGNCIEYYSQGAKFRIYDPSISYPDENKMVVSTQIDNENVGGDDHIYISLTVDSNKNVVSIEYSADYEDGKSIPKATVLTADLVIALVAVSVAVETEGASLEAGLNAIEDLNTVVKYYNDIIDYIQRFTDVDGGKFYLSSVGAHTAIRMLNSITNS